MRLGEPRGEVRVEHAAAATRGAGRARGGPAVSDLEVGGDRGELLRVERPARRREQPQDPPALERADGQAAHDQLVERAGERRRRQLAAGGQQLLGHERAAAGSLGDEEQQAGRGALALDPLDERRQLVTVEERQRQPLHAAAARRRWSPGRGPRVVARDDVRLVRGDERQPLVASDPGEERHERAGRGVGAMQVLEDRARPGWRSPSRPSMPRTPSRVRAWRRSGAPGRLPVDGSRPPVEPGRELGQQPGDARRSPGRGRRRARRPGARRAPVRSPGRPARTARPCRPASPRRAGRSSARSARRCGPIASSRKRLMPDAGRAADRASPGPVRWPRRRGPRPAARRRSSRPTYRALVYRAGMTAF